MASQNSTANGCAAPLYLSDGQLDEQLCYILTLVRQRLYEKNTIITSLQRSMELERISTFKRCQALQQELAEERSWNRDFKNEDVENDHAENEDAEHEHAKNEHAMHAKDSLGDRNARSIERCDIGSESTESERSKQSPKVAALRQRRLGKEVLMNPLTINTESHTPLVRVGVKSSEDCDVSNQRRRTKRVRKC